MNEYEFNDQIDELMIAIEDAIEELETDIDYENAGGILTLTFENGSQIILSRQAALTQLWVAARSGGFHFDFDEEQQLWICDSNGEELVSLLNNCASEQSGEEIQLDIA
ncbi:iron donor protein CyaY [Parendozoicomonas haliclonae]|uniref:Iron-sulfur cluster assembly protein CyaY n=1 Tax=Parendozoicomonas haliclonae TaxID=1960125 RepID=A0A1X7ANI1_9GAMM|nr:iron donor protein CyaY [Parendozoicomonas haliclonae]SMA48460.1 frataxin-like protein [Parendozoicomonas haliclonae]